MMDITNPTSPDEDPNLENVAAKIQRLPDNVVPSEHFLIEMRLRLLRLRQDKASGPPKAA